MTVFFIYVLFLKAFLLATLQREKEAADGAITLCVSYSFVISDQEMEEGDGLSGVCTVCQVKKYKKNDLFP